MSAAAAPFVGDEDISLASEFGLDSPFSLADESMPTSASTQQAPPPSQSTQPSAQSVHFSLYAARSPTTQPGQSRKNKRKKSRATFSQAAGSVLQENETVPVEILATQTQTPICGQNEENVLSQPPAARTRSGGKTAKIIPPPPAAPRTIPQPAAPQTPVTEVASQPTVAVTERRKSRPMSASQPLSSIGSRVHRRSGRLAEQVGRKSGSSSSHGNRQEDPIVVEDIAGNDEVTHEPSRQPGRVSWGTPQTLWAQFGSGFIANQNNDKHT
ncbi:hypothetical protein CJ030_MR0G020157 [Morella rubra]|uniref:Uncharacterized protein n=1 Tax=Morella rubra TaxID=262757 RepID=A0A6A1UH39_9ROSI|nr:hypothetical protein CJ030_MR0G020157 [Morella rubra]